MSVESRLRSATGHVGVGPLRSVLLVAVVLMLLVGGGRCYTGFVVDKQGLVSKLAKGAPWYSLSRNSTTLVISGNADYIMFKAINTDSEDDIPTLVAAVAAYNERKLVARQGYCEPSYAWSTSYSCTGLYGWNDCLNCAKVDSLTYGTQTCVGVDVTAGGTWADTLNVGIDYSYQTCTSWSYQCNRNSGCSSFVCVNMYYLFYICSGYADVEYYCTEEYGSTTYTETGVYFSGHYPYENYVTCSDCTTSYCS